MGGGESSKKLETFGEGLISRLFLKADSEQLVSFIILLFSKSLAIAGIFTTHLLGIVFGREFEEL